MPAEQIDLAIKKPAPAVQPAEVEMLLQVLKSAGGWCSARVIANALGMREAESSERHVRAIASAAAPAVVSYPGSPGYKLWALCSIEEINHCIEAFESQGKDMMKRAHVYRMAYHRRFRGAPVDNGQAQLL